MEKEIIKNNIIKIAGFMAYWTYRPRTKEKIKIMMAKSSQRLTLQEKLRYQNINCDLYEACCYESEKRGFDFICRPCPQDNPANQKRNKFTTTP